MENQFTKLKKSLDSIDNKFSAGLSGDLAEVCVYQGSLYGTNVTIGLDGVWNNTDLPTLRYSMLTFLERVQKVAQRTNLIAKRYPELESV